MSKPKYQIGARYRINCQNHPNDGMIGTLERLQDGSGWVLVRGDMKLLPLSCLSANGVLQQVPERLPKAPHFVRQFEVLGSSF